MKRFDSKIIFLIIISVAIVPVNAAKKTGFSPVTSARYIRYKKSNARPILSISPEQQAMVDKKEIRQCKENCCTAVKAGGLLCCALVVDNCVRELWNS
jgi:hypothetical protein